MERPNRVWYADLTYIRIRRGFRYIVAIMDWRTRTVLTWRNGVWVAKGNLAIRHLGIPTVTVPMGLMADIGMPAGLAFAERGLDDLALLQLACTFEATGAYHKPAPRCP